MITLNNRVAVITGAAQGIGKAITLKFAQAGADVVIVDSKYEGAVEASKEVEAMGRKAIAVQCNVADAQQVDALVKQVQEKFQKVDILVNNAGVTRDNLMMRMQEADWDLVLNVNLKGPFLLVKAFSPLMMRQRYGRIINVASVVGLMGNAGQTNYSASKGGLIAFTKSVAKELASRNITCNAIAPGFIETPMTEKLPDTVKESYIKAIPLNRFGKVDDVASTIIFLASEEAGYITGQVIGIDGGMFMR
jgi:3-oxoacyl-[acyl-carrier protein] reductase